MRLWRYNDIGDEITFSPIIRCVDDDEILEMYWEYWSEGMKRRGYTEKEITKEACIDEWVVVNWAWEVSTVNRNS
jgi:phosphotransacetylase